MSAPTAPATPRLQAGNRTDPLLSVPAGAAVARMHANEIAKSLRVVWTFRGTVVASLVTTLLTYLAIQYFIGGGAIVDELVAITAPGLFAYVVAFIATLRVVSGLLEDRNTGTLEQAHLSPLPAGQLVLGRLAAAMIEATLVAVAVVGGVLLLRGVSYSLSWAALLPLGLTLAGIAGLGLLLAAVSFVLPGIGALLHILHMVIMVLNGTIAPPEVFPRWLELIATIVPSTLGIRALRELLLADATIGDLWRDGSMGWLLLHTGVLLLGGWAAYRWQAQRALRDGRMGPT